MPLRLVLLGGARIEVDGAPLTGRAAQRRRLALLAILALSPRRAATREHVLGYLWADHPPDAARRLLSEAVYVLRRTLGERVLASVGDELALDGAVESDVDEFLAAVAAGDAAAAVALYAGPLFGGWYVRDAPDFVRWADNERARLAALYAQVVQTRAAAREVVEDWVGAAALWRTLARADPYSSVVAWHAARALARAGERAAALQSLAAHEALLQADLGVGLDAKLTALSEAIRSGTESPQPVDAPAPAAPHSAPREAEVGAVDPPPPTHAHPPEHGTATVDTRADDVSGHPTAPARVPSVVSRLRGPSTKRWPAAATALIIGAALTAAATLWARANTTSSAAPQRVVWPATVRLDPQRVAVLYFQDRSERRGLEYLADGLTEELIRELTGLGPLRVLSQDAVRPYRGRDVPVDSVARALRAGTVVSATLRETGSRIYLVARVVDGATGDQLAVDTITRPRGAALALANELAARVAGVLRPVVGARSAEQQHAAERARRSRSDRALDLSFRAERLRHTAVQARLASGAPPQAADGARRALRAADSLLATAEAADPTWPRLALERGWVAVAAGRLEHGTARVVALASGFAHAERALTLQRVGAPGDSATGAQALYLRGALAVRTATAVQTFRRESAMLRAGVEDLRGAVALDSGLAGAWAMLAMAEYVDGHFERAERAAANALRADAYLVEAPDVIGWAWRSAAMRGDHRAAEQWCARGRQLVPKDWHFVECELSLMRYDAAGLSGRPPEPMRASLIARELERIDPGARARAAGHPYSPVYRRLVVAAVHAAAGQRVTARAALDAALRDVRGDAELSTDVLYDAAFVRFLLGDREVAERDLAAYLRARPDLADLLARDRTLAAVRRGPAGWAAPGRSTSR